MYKIWTAQWLDPEHTTYIPQIAIRLVTWEGAQLRATELADRDDIDAVFVENTTTGICHAYKTLEV